MKATDIVGYKADADLYCPPCTALLYDRRLPTDGLHTVTMGNALDSEGNPVAPVFASDATEGDTCGRCHGGLLEEYDPRHDPFVRPKVSANDDRAALVEALALARTQIRDMANGWPERELHEPPSETIERIDRLIGPAEE